jgi:hypothetical protein
MVTDLLRYSPEVTVEGLYAAFAGVPRPVRVAGCPHCVAPDEDRPLLDRPLRSIEAGALARYAAKALNTWGDVADFRYFVPRLLECAAADAFGYPDPPIVFGKLASAGWRRWAPDERAAIEAFLGDWWAGTLDRFPSTPPAGTVLCCLGLAGVDLDPFLEHWGRLATVAAVRHLHEFVTYEVRWPDRLADAFWDRVAAAPVIAWLTGGRAAAAVEAAFDAAADEDVLRLLDEIHPALRVA